jgi:hypothetical protein
MNKMKHQCGSISEKHRKYLSKINGGNNGIISENQLSESYGVSMVAAMAAKKPALAWR